MTATFQFINGFRAAKGVDPARVQQELEEVSDIYGKLTAENVLLYAEQRPESALYASMEWNDGEAARKFRLHQAYNIIRCIVVVEEQKEPYRSFTLVKQNDETEYLPTTVVIQNPDLLADGLRRLLREVEGAKNSVEQLIRIAEQKGHGATRKLHRANAAITKAVNVLKV